MGTETSSEAQVQGYNDSNGYNYPYANPLSQPYAKSSTANNYYNRMVLNDSFSRARENQSLDYYYSRAEYDRPKPNYTSYWKYPNPRYPNSYAEVPSTYRRPSYPRDYSAYYPPAVQTPMPPTTEVHPPTTAPAYAPIAAPQARPAPPPIAANPPVQPPTAQSYYPAAQQSPLLSQQLYYRPSQPTLRPETAQQMAPPIEQQQIAAPQSQLSNYQYPAYSSTPVQQQSSLTQQGQIAPSYQYPAPTQVPTQVLTQAPTQATTRATTQQSSQQPVVHRIVIENIPSPYVYQPVQRSLSYCSDTEIHSVRYRPRYRKSYHHHRHRHHKRSSRKYVCLPPKEDYLNEVDCMPC